MVMEKEIIRGSRTLTTPLIELGNRNDR
jgi:hypothetical protein